MNTCVLCFSRRNALECTIRSRSRWNGVRSGESGSGTTLRAGYERVASGDSHACSHAWVRSWKCSTFGVTVAMDSFKSPRRGGGKFAPLPRTADHGALERGRRRARRVHLFLHRVELVQRVGGRVRPHVRPQALAIAHRPVLVAAGDEARMRIPKPVAL